MFQEKKMLLVFNPIAGTGDFRENLYPVLDTFTKKGFLVTAYPTQGVKDAYDTVLKYGTAYDYLVCSGGDGTLNEVVGAMMEMEKRPLFGYFPSGTTNDFANSLGLPLDVTRAANTICEGVPQPIDIGQFGSSSYFSYIAAFGLFTDVSYDTPQSLKNMIGHAAYVLSGAIRLANIESYHCKIICDGEEISGKYIMGMVTNSESIGGFRPHYTHKCKQGDGLYKLILLKSITNFRDLQDVIGMLTGIGHSSSFVTRAAKNIRFEFAQPVNWTLDGEYGGAHKTVDIQIHAHALHIMTPAREQNME